MGLTNCHGGSDYRLLERCHDGNVFMPIRENRTAQPTTETDMPDKITLITRLGYVLEAARLDGNTRRVLRCRKALRTLGAVA